MLTLSPVFRQSGFTPYQLNRARGEFEQWCELLGHRLGVLGQAIIIGADEDAAADKHVVRCFIRGVRETRAHNPSTASPTPLVSIIREGGRISFEQARQEHASLNLFTGIPRPANERGCEADCRPGSRRRDHRRRI